MRDQPLEQFVFPSMRTQIAGIKDFLPIGLDQQCITVVCRMIHQERCDRERIEADWLVVDQGDDVVEVPPEGENTLAAASIRWAAAPTRKVADGGKREARP